MYLAGLTKKMMIKKQQQVEFLVYLLLFYLGINWFVTYNDVIFSMAVFYV